MKLHQCHWVVLAAFAVMGTAAAGSAKAQLIFYSPMGPFMRSPMMSPSYSYSYGPYNPYGYNPYGYNPYGYNPYTPPYPSGAQTGPVLLSPWQFTDDKSGRTAEDYGYLRDPAAQPVRKRETVYPAIPYQPVPGHRLADIRRVRFEIDVPSENAVVRIDGADTKQTGLSRVYVTPPMAEDRLFSSEFEVRWTDDQGKTHSARKTFEFVAGETIRHTFK